MKRIVFVLSILAMLAFSCAEGLSVGGGGEPVEPLPPYEGGDLGNIEGDKQLAVVGAKLTPEDKFQSGAGIDKTIDGNLGTGYHSPWSGIDPSTDIIFEYFFDPQATAEDQTLNYILLTPRQNGQNGIFKEGQIFVKSQTSTDYTLAATFSFDESNTPKAVYFDTPIINPTAVKIVVTDAYSHDAGKYYVSLREFEAYESTSTEGLDKESRYFTDGSYSELIPSFTSSDLPKIENLFVRNMANYILNGSYNKRGFRVQEYRAYETLATHRKALKVSIYNAYENPTGIYFKTGEDVVVFVGETGGADLSLRVTDFSVTPPTDHAYALRKGPNLLSIKGSGNGYLSYYTDDYQTVPKVKINIASGKVNGYYDMAKHKEAEATQLLDSAVSPIFDLVGNNVQLAYSVNSLKTYAGQDLHALIATYDTILGIQNHMMGLAKYNKNTTNRIFGRVIWEGYMHADATGAAFHDNTMRELASVSELNKGNGIWGIAHEFGHVNQVRPEVKWVGTAECTNNIYSVYTQYLYSRDNLRLEHENVGGEIGGRFNAYLNNAFVKNQEWGLQAGPDRDYGIKANGKWGGDHFVKVCPLWQLQLYFHIAGEGNTWHKPWFWQEIFEAARQHTGSTGDHGRLQLNFVEYVCDAVQMDLSDFFIEIGMLQEVDKHFDDYASAQKTITQQMINEVVAKVAKYPKPKHPIKYISGNTIEAYQKQLPVEGIYGQGVSGADNKVISHAVWKNAVVFETYKNDELIKITLAGTGTKDNSSTSFRYPADATRIEAVAFDGTKTLVYGTR